MKFEDLKIEYNKRNSCFELLKSEAERMLEYSVNKANIKFHSISSRVKNLESLNDKIERKQIENPFYEITDIVGLRIVCLFLSQISEIEKVIEKSFVILSKDDKIEDYEDSSFGYMSAHFIVKMKDNIHYSDIKGIPFEIQVRTLSMDTWASISHHLDYKSKDVVPTELKREFYALSALLYIADTSFERFYNKRQESLDVIDEALEKNKFSLNQEINLDTLAAYLQRKYPDRTQPKTSSEIKNLSELIIELEKVGCKKLSEIDSAVNANKTKLKKREDEKSNGSLFYSAVGAVRMTFRLINPDFDKIIKDKVANRNKKKKGKK